MNASARLRLRQLLVAFRQRAINVEKFCADFEHIYNLELDKGTLTPAEMEAFASLFESVIWFSPFEEERLRIPNYKDEAAIEAAAELAAARIEEEERSGL
jgi:hypothetical protein